MTDDHNEDLFELVGTHGWRALKEEADQFLSSFRSNLERPAQTEFDFVKKEVDAGVVRELRRFFAYIEEIADRTARNRKR